MTTQNIDVYSNQEISKLEKDVYEMETKNKKLREILTSMGVQTSTVQNGAVTIVENRDVEYWLSH